MKKLIFVCVLVLALAMNASAGITYVDATQGASGNTQVAFGIGGNVVFDLAANGGVGLTADAGGTDNLWRVRAFGNGATIYESGGTYGDTANPENCPTLLTTVNTGCELGEGDYINVYAYFWSDSSSWRMKAIQVKDIPLFTQNPIGTGNTAYGDTALAFMGDFDFPIPLLDEGGRFLWQINLGTTTNPVIQVLIDDDELTIGHNQRTWYDGLGYECIPEPATIALLGLGGLALIRKRK